ncbi:MAG: biotin--[acetyl-CoA-carboxylase] ligase [Planctomycetaceae bacterium]|nr:biotin--[acetyl-CoA-carboxylase] ligase [Planctomycetaceae bacterium]
MDNPAFRFRPPVWLDEATSTNDVVKERVAEGLAESGDVVAARRQTRGRGRMDAVWESSQEGDLTFSFYWTGAVPIAALGSLAMSCALGVRDFLAVRNVASTCKWPNDVLVGDAKICGILAEGGSLGGGGNRYGLVVGIGVNLRRVNGRSGRFNRAIATLEDYVQDMPPQQALLDGVLASLQPRIDAWQRLGFAAVRDDLLANFWGMGKSVSAKTAKGKVEGVVTGLGENGELCLRRPDGTDVAVSSVTALEGWDVNP